MLAHALPAVILSDQSGSRLKMDKRNGHDTHPGAQPHIAYGPCLSMLRLYRMRHRVFYSHSILWPWSASLLLLLAVCA